ncbi:MAG: NifB/NifX family molybdenum-iron cluster-binding protein [Bacteroidales bacterium]|nr:NifB/NifX family molybdenum-iron cluster-binding protein [Bacteroidales bacterium]
MKIAVPTRDNFVDGHFGHCENYTIFTVNDNKEIVESEIMDSPQGCGCKSNIAGILQEKGVSFLLAGNMGEGALNKLNAFGINVIRGCSGDATELVKSYLDGNLNDSGESCSHHGDHH